MFGRRMIFTEAAVIDEGNILEVLQKAYDEHVRNEFEIDYLYRYYKGEQPILNRVKEVRPEICARIVVNRANEIVTFKTGYHLGEPVQYVSRSDDAETTDAIIRLNDYMLAEDKHAKDKELDDWAHICGTSYRMALPDAETDLDSDEAPFEIYTLDPRRTFVVYSNALGNKAMMGVTFVKKENGTIVFSCYTKDKFFEVENPWNILRIENQILGIPIIEYPANIARLGAFEVVLPLLDAINLVESNRMDGVEQFIQALMLFHNVDISADDFKKLKDLGGLKFRDIDPQMKAEVEYLTAEMDQGNTQTLVNSMYNTVLTICGMPSVSDGNTSDSSNNGAVIMKNGWQGAEARAKDSDMMFKKSEKEFLKLVLGMCRDMVGLKLKLSALEIRFTRRNYENISEKATVLTMMLGCDKIAPELAFVSCGLFSDPQLAYRKSLEYMKEAQNVRTSEAAPGSGGSDK